MRICHVWSLGLLLVAGCSATSPFATTAQKPVPIAAQLAEHGYGGPGSPAPSPAPSPLAGAPQQQFTQTGPNTFAQTVPTSNSFLAGLRSTGETIGNAFTIEPRVIPATGATSLASEPAEIGADLHFQAAQVYEGQNNVRGAITHFQKALEISPRDPRILVGFGRLYDRQNELKRAEGLYQQALQVDPNHCAALNAIGICYAKQGNLDAALAHLSRAAQLQPLNARYKNNMANVLADAGRLEEAYLQLLAVHGEAGAHYNLGYLLHHQGKRDLARQELGFALQANPNMKQARDLLASLDPASTPVRPASGEPELPGRYSVSEPLTAPTVNPNATASPVNAPVLGQGPLTRPESLPPL